MKTKFKRNPSMVDREIRGEVLLVPLMSSEESLESIYALNKTAAWVWRDVGDGYSIEAATRRLVDNFEVSEEQAADDVHAVVEDLKQIKALLPAER